MLNCHIKRDPAVFIYSNWCKYGLRYLTHTFEIQHAKPILPTLPVLCLYETRGKSRFQDILYIFKSWEGREEEEGRGVASVFLVQDVEDINVVSLISLTNLNCLGSCPFVMDWSNRVHYIKTAANFRWAQHMSTDKSIRKSYNNNHIK